MNKEEIFAVWADERSVWSRWAKPVLFAHFYEAMEPQPLPEITEHPALAMPARKDTALVLDLPGATGVAVGVALARRGCRPVALYNANPQPTWAPATYGPDGKRVAAVDVWPIMHALNAGAPLLAEANVPVDAPPAFLLDAGRTADWRKMLAEEFDNRSICFTTDFPSANFLAAQGIGRVVLVQKNGLEPQGDLAHVLRRWQEGGMRLERMQLDSDTPPAGFEVAKPRWYAAMFQRLFAAAGLHRARGGGFGNWVAESSGGG